MCSGEEGGQLTTRSTADGGFAATEVDVVVVEATVSPAQPEPPADQPSGLWRTVRLALGMADAAGETVAMAVERRRTPAADGWNVAVGAGLVAGAAVAAGGRLAARVVRPVAMVMLHPPLVPEEWHPARGVEALARLGSQERAAARRDLDRAVTALVPVVVERVLERMSLTDLVMQHVDVDAIVAGVDLDAIVARIDLDAIAGRLDIEAIISRMDLVGLADQVIEGIDLPEIIRESTGTVASEVVRGVRMQSIDADEAIARVVDRLFLRRRRRATDAPGEPLSLAGDDDVDLTAPVAGDGARPEAPS
jgi:hypothetical protein